MIAVVAGTLAVNVVWKGNQFSKGAAKSRKDLRGVTQDMRKAKSATAGLTGQFGKLAAIIGGAISVRAGFNFLKQQTMEIDVLGKVSHRLGIATEDLGAFQFAAKLAGVNTQTFNMGLQRATRRIGEFIKGSGEAKKTLEELGFTADELQGMNIAEQFLAVTDAIRGISDGNLAIAATQKVFDSEAVALQQLEGSLRASLKLYKELNLQISGTDVSKVEKMTSNFTVLTEAMKGFGRDFIIDVSPAASLAVKGALELIKEARQDKAAIEARGITMKESQARHRQKLRESAFVTGVGDIAGFFPSGRFRHREAAIKQDELETERRATLRRRQSMTTSSQTGEPLAPFPAESAARPSGDRITQILSDQAAETRESRKLLQQILDKDRF